jgi:hypothetical protein
MQIALAIKYEELTGNIVQPTPNDIYSVQYKIKNKKTYQKRS